MSLKVTKFGGSSLADANQFKKVYDIVLADPDRRYVVPSAPGKRFSNDVKVTDMLYRCYAKAAAGRDFDEDFETIKERYNGIISELGLDLNLSEEFRKIRHAFESSAGSDYAASRGEYLSGMILANYLGYYFMDAGKCVRFNDNGSFNMELTIEKTRQHLSNHERAVIPGFYGRMPNDTIKTFSRGGSDITGSLVARATGADIYENWTDVNGFLVADPRIVDNPNKIDKITYRELRELSYMGATVLHEDAVFPVHQAGIPVNIRNTNDPSNSGTMIVENIEGESSGTTITGIAGKKGMSTIFIEKAMMNQEVGFGRRVLEILEDLGISFEHLPSGIDTMSIVVDSKYLSGKEQTVIDKITRKCGADCVHIESGYALIATVGRNMRNTAGTAAKVTAALAKQNINIRMIDQGSSELNIIIGVDENRFNDAISAIYNEFCL